MRNMPTFFQRKILKVGDSVGITIPNDIVKSHDIKKGHIIKIVTDGTEHEGILLIDLRNRSNEELWKIIKETY